MTESTTINTRQLINDKRWQSRVGSILDIVAILKDIEDRKQFINTHAIRANPLDVAVNLLRIHEEAEGMAGDIEKIRARLYRLYEVSVQDIYRDWEQKETDTVNVNDKNSKQKVRLKLRKDKQRKPRRMFRGGNRKNGSNRTGGAATKDKEGHAR